MKRILSLCVLIACATAHADDEVAGWQVAWDNDLWAKGKTDRWYTNGLRLTWTYNKPPENDLSKLFLRGSEWFLWEEPTPTLSYSVGQAMYTPRDIRLAVPPIDDRPWGAFLYFGVTAHAYKGIEFRATELKMGVTGKYALGEQTQKLIHRLTSSAEPQGWDQQLNARPGVQLTHARVYRLGDTLANESVAFQVGWGAGLGTLRARANMDAAIVIGSLGGENTPLLIGNEGDFIVQDFNNRPQFLRPFVYLAANVTGVAYNYFLEGSTPYGKAQIEPKRTYTVLTIGASLPLQRWMGPSWPRLVYSQSTRSAEFTSSTTAGLEEQRQRWGTLTLHWDLD
jgi:hypothetical protein